MWSSCIELLQTLSICFRMNCLNAERMKERCKLIGGRIISKRVSKMLECCSPCSYIMIDKHPMRHDPSHIVTHRIQSTIKDFAHTVKKSCIPCDNSKWKAYLRVLNLMVGEPG